MHKPASTEDLDRRIFHFQFLRLHSQIKANLSVRAEVAVIERWSARGGIGVLPKGCLSQTWARRPDVKSSVFASGEPIALAGIAAGGRSNARPIDLDQSP